MDMDALYFDLLQFKNERGWHNLYIPREVIIEQLLNPDSQVLIGIVCSFREPF